MPNGVTAERIARNDAVFRAANEGIRDAALRYDVRERVPFVCECAEERCTEILRVSLDEYERVRAHPTRFLHAPGHEEPHTRVVAEEDGYVVVEKLGAAADVARETDPRS